MKFVLLLLAFASVSLAQTVDPIFKNLRPQHPRLMWTADQIEELKKIGASDPLAVRWQKALIGDAEKISGKPLIEYSLTSKKLLNESRAALDCISTLAGLYQLTGNKQFAERARKELLNVAAFEDWNPANFLATAEMTNAVAIGYDWLFDYLSADDKAVLKRAIIDKGLKPGLEIYASGKGWPRVKHNWNSVCNFSLIIGALAIADDEPALSAKIISEARNSLQKGFLDFAPDGGWPEGPGYWSYCTSYAAFGLSALQSALGTDFDLQKSSGFSETGDFRIQTIGTSRNVFGFADSTSEIRPAVQMFWLAKTFNRPAYDASEREIALKKPDIFHLVWFNPQFGNAAAEAALKAMPLSQKFAGTNVAVLRSGAGDQATFIGIKGGDNKTNHADLDLGTFVLDSHGQRFACELGPDNYTLPGYFSKNRWDYYRTRSEGQNTLVIDGANQGITAKAPIISFSDRPEKPFAVIDLTDGYGPSATKILRGIATDPQGRVWIQDEIELKQPADVVWIFHTNAQITIDGAGALLKLGNASMNVKIISPADAVFKVTEVNLAAPQRSSPNLRKLAITLPSKISKSRIAVRFTPAGEEADAALPAPLSSW